jgi:hypothetical protein
MSAAKLRIEWNEGEDRELSEAVGPSPESTTSQKRFAFVREIASAVTTLRCPHCESIVYSRRSKVCGVCSRELPEKFLFSPREAARVENILRSERSRHRKWMNRVFSEPIAFTYLD